MSKSFEVTHHETMEDDMELPTPLKHELPLRQLIPEDIQSPGEVPFNQDNTEKDSTTHIDLEMLQENITDAIKAAYSQNSRYYRVFVLLMYWNDEVSDRKHMGPIAQRLGETFKRLFNYDVEEFQIPSRNPFSKMTSKLLKVQDIISDEESNNLFILYYGGHASFKSRGHDVYQEAFWHPSVAAAASTTGKSLGIELSSVESLLADFDSDILFLFDCCFATGMIQRDRKWRKQCEILGASGSLEKACGGKDKSFTTAVTNLLEQQMEGSHSTSVVGLISKLKDRQYLRSLPNRLTTTPDYVVLSQAQSSPIHLIPLNNLSSLSSDNVSTSGSSVTTLIDTFDGSDARVLLSIAISGMPAVTALTEFFNHRPGTFASIESTSRRKDDPLLHALFNSDSLIAIVSMPIWLWYFLPQTRAYHYIGRIRSGCLLRGGKVDVGIEDKIPYCNAEVQTETVKIFSKYHDSVEEENQQSLVPHGQEERRVRPEQAVGTHEMSSISWHKSHTYDDQEPEMMTRDKGLDRSEVGKFETSSWFSPSPMSEALPPYLPPELKDSGIEAGQNSYLQISMKRESMPIELSLYSEADVNTRKGNHRNTLKEAVHKSSETIVELFPSAGADVNAQGGGYGNALQAAAHKGLGRVAQLLLGAGADVNSQGGEYGSALQAAAHQGFEEIVQLLLDAGADVNAQGGYYSNALQAAAASYQSSGAIMQLLLDAGADVNAQGGFYGHTLQAAAYQGSGEIIQLLLDAGADVNSQGGEYGSALQAAAHQGLESIVQLLLDAGADVNAQGGEYGNALQAAAVSYQGSGAIMQLLLDAGADVNAQGGEYGNALQSAARKGSEAIVQLLLDAGADVNAQGGYYSNALQAAAYQGAEAAMELLLRAGADVNAQGGYYSNALQAAAVSYQGSGAVMQLLLDAGADVNAQGGEYGNALQAAVGASYQVSGAIIQLLLDAGADVNAQGGYYSNALQAAAYRGSETVMRLLLRAGANIYA